MLRRRREYTPSPARRSASRRSARDDPPSARGARHLFYQAHRAPEDPQLFYLYEQYVDEAGYEAHMDSEHFTRLVKGEAIPELLEAREREFFETL